MTDTAPHKDMKEALRKILAEEHERMVGKDAASSGGNMSDRNCLLRDVGVTISSHTALNAMGRVAQKWPARIGLLEASRLAEVEAKKWTDAAIAQRDDECDVEAGINDARALVASSLARDFRSRALAGIEDDRLSASPSRGEVLEGWKLVPLVATDDMTDFVRHLWLWYAGCHSGSTWTLGKHNKSGGHKWILTDEEASAPHLPKHSMAQICYRNMLAKSPSPPLKQSAHPVSEVTDKEIDLLKLLRDAGVSEKTRTALTRTVWKDGIDIDEPCRDLERFVELLTSALAYGRKG